MTSTHTFQGMESGSKPSSRVTAPPGGGSSNIFGHDSPTPVKQPPKTQPPAQTQENIFGQPQQTQQKGSDRNIRGAPRQAFNPITGEPYGPSPVKADAQAPTDENEKKDKEETENQNGSGGDVSSSTTTTQQQSRPMPTGERQERPSTRVMAPPGGKSTTRLW